MEKEEPHATTVRRGKAIGGVEISSDDMPRSLELRLWPPIDAEEDVWAFSSSAVDRPAGEREEGRCEYE